MTEDKNNYVKSKNEFEVGDKESVYKAKMVEDKTREILNFLQLEPSQEPIIQLKNAMSIHKYIVLNCSYTTEIMQEKLKMLQDIVRGQDIDLILEELYNGLVKKRGVCTTEAIMFKYLLSKIGMKGDVVMLRSKDGTGKHVTTLVEIGTKRYYFETGLERKIFEQQSGDPENLEYYCARNGERSI